MEIARVVTAGAAIFVIALTAFSADAAAAKMGGAQQADQGRAAAAVHLMRASKLIGMEVRDRRGQLAGSVPDLVIDANNDRVVCIAVVSEAGVGDRVFPVPISALAFPAGAGHVELKMSKERLGQAPHFEGATWPDWRDDRYRRLIDRFHGVPAPLRKHSDPRLVRASQLIGKDVEDSDGENAGRIIDLLIDVARGSVRHALLNFQGPWLPTSRGVPMPLDAFRFPSDRDRNLMLKVPRERVDTSAPSRPTRRLVVDRTRFA